MTRKHIIVVERCPDIVQCWGSLKRACEANELPYWTLARKKFPISHGEYVIRKVRFNTAERD